MHSEPIGKSRVEAFSDGVIAIAITLLVLDLAVPRPGGHGSLAHRLSQQWPSYAAYVVSFLTIGVIWINHHAMLRRLTAVDHSVLILNLLLLLSIGVLPWSTALMADYLRAGGSGRDLAAAIYSGSFLVMAVVFLLMQRHILFHREHLLDRRIGAEQRSLIMRRNCVGVLPYALATPLAFLSPYATIAICGLIVVFYARSSTTSDQ